MESRSGTTQLGTAPASTPDRSAADTGAPLRREAVKGVATMLPLLVGYLPFALLIGVAAGGSVNPLAAWAGGIMIFGGSAQLSVIQLVDGGSGVAAVVATGLLINARVTVYSTSLLSLWRGAPLRHRLLAAAAVIDPIWMVARRREAQPGTAGERRAFFAGAAVTLATGWCTFTGLGVLVGAHQGSTAFLGIGVPLCLSAIVAPHLRSAAGARCVVAAGAVAVGTASWPAGTGLLLAMAAGAAAGSWRPRAVRS